ncbi:MAG: zinc ABC transporter substrate-binding protein [Alphaproteobacteria bacterium]
MLARIAGILWALFIALHPDPALADGPAVVTTIKPLHSLVAGVMAGVGTPVLLVDGAASEHAYALRPSQAAALSKADLVFWVGPLLETFMIRPMANLAPSAIQISLSESAGVQLLPARNAGDLHAGHAAGTETPSDMHIWLDPDNAAAMVRDIAAKLQARDPANATTYARNATALEVRLLASSQQIAARLAAARPAPYIVFHDAYQYFENRFGLTPAATVSLDPERPPGAGRIRELRKLIADKKIVCVFAEPQFEPRIIDTLVEGADIKVAVLDPLGAGLEAGGEMYFALLDQLVNALTGCPVQP